MSVMTDHVVVITDTPKVNLLPPEIAEAARFRRLQLAMGGVVAVAAIIVGSLYAHAHGQVSQAQNQITQAQSQTTALNAKLASLHTVQTTYAEVQGKQALLAEAMGGEIRWSFMLNDLSMILPSHVWLTNVTASESDPSSAITSSSSSASATGTTSTGSYGTVTFSGNGFTHDDVAAWLLALSKEKGFASPTFSASTESGGDSQKEVTFSTSVDLTKAELSQRYTNGTGQ